MSWDEATRRLPGFGPLASSEGGLLFGRGCPACNPHCADRRRDRVIQAAAAALRFASPRAQTSSTCSGVWGFAR